VAGFARANSTSEWAQTNSNLLSGLSGRSQKCTGSTRILNTSFHSHSKLHLLVFRPCSKLRLSGRRVSYLAKQVAEARVLTEFIHRKMDFSASLALQPENPGGLLLPEERFSNLVSFWAQLEQRILTSEVVRTRRMYNKQHTGTEPS
jgi:hypothetical protein